MAIGIRVGYITDEIGAPSFLHSFFSTVSYYGEPAGWGTRYPCLTGRPYQGHLPAQFATQALQELSDAKMILSSRPPSDVIWDIENLAAKPPWGDNICQSITNLGNYFVTSTGRDLFSVLEECLLEAAQNNRDARIE